MRRNLCFGGSEQGAKRQRICWIEETIDLFLGHACIIDDCLVVYRVVWEPCRVDPSLELGHVREIVIGANGTDLGWIDRHGILLHVPSAVGSRGDNGLGCVTCSYFKVESPIQNALSDVEGSLNKQAHGNVFIGTTLRQLQIDHFVEVANHPV